MFHPFRKSDEILTDLMGWMNILVKFNNYLKVNVAPHYLSAQREQLVSSGEQSRREHANLRCGLVDGHLVQCQGLGRSMVTPHTTI